MAQDWTTAVAWFRKAVEQGYADANFKFNLADACKYGNGVVQNIATAVAWYRKAAAQGHVDAQGSLTGMYELGWDFHRDAAARQLDGIERR